MKPVEFRNAYYVKLGRKGEWEESSIREKKIRIGWTRTDLNDINNGNWTKIRKELERECKNKGTATCDYHALRRIAESTPDDVWITFHSSRLWWCKLGKTEMLEDEVSKHRKVEGKWHYQDIHDNTLIINQIPGSLSKLQGFRGTICRVKEVDDLRRLLNDQPSEAFKAIAKATESLVMEIEQGLRLLHWKDFETLVDLLFRGAGWRRVSLLGETMKYVDLELEEPITGDLYQVQVKSRATKADFEEYAQNFSGAGFRKLYFVVHSPVGEWNAEQAVESVELLLPKRIAKMVVEFGLTRWLMNRIK